MKLGFVSAILDGWTFEEMIDTASEMGFSCVEVACWPQGRAERRYAGVSHIDVDSLSDEKAAYILNYCKERKVKISSLAYYPNTLDGNLEKRACVVEHLKNVIRASHKLGVNMVTTFIGRDQTKSVEQNLALVKEVWPPIIALAEELGVTGKEPEFLFAQRNEYHGAFHGKPFHDNEIAWVYLLVLDRPEEAFTPEACEVESVHWFSVREILRAMRENDPRFCLREAEFCRLLPYLAQKFGIPVDKL